MGKSIGKAFAVLEALARAPGPQRVSDLALGIGFSEPTTCRLLASLVELGYATRDATTGRYGPTLKLWEISQHVVGRTDDLQVIAQPVLAALSSATGESCALGVFDDGYAVYIAKADGTNAIRAVATVGARIPASATGFGKAILAWRADLVPLAIARVQRFTRRTIMTRRDLERDLEAARARGYAITQGELHDDVCAIGAPVFDRSGAVVAAIALWGSREGILGRRQDELARETMAAAQRISARLGYVNVVDTAVERTRTGRPRSRRVAA